MTVYLRCPICHAWQPVTPDTPHDAFICPTCTAQNVTPHLAPFRRLWEAMRGKIRWTTTAVFIALYLLAMAGMGVAMMVR